MVDSEAMLLKIGGLASGGGEGMLPERLTCIFSSPGIARAVLHKACWVIVRSETLSYI